MRDHRRTTASRVSTIAAVGLVAVLLIGAVGPATATHPNRAVVVALHDDGSAELSVTYTFDLDSDAERQAFTALQDNESVRETYRTRFEERIRSVAATTAAQVDRTMSVSNATIDVRTTDGTGIVTLSVTWRNLAAVEGDTLVVSEPFASGFAPGRAFALVPPDGYQVTSVSPQPDSTADGHLVWDAGTSLSGFQATLEPTDGSGDAATDAGDGTGAPGNTGPGFGVAAAVLGLIGAALLAAQRSGRL